MNCTYSYTDLKKWQQTSNTCTLQDDFWTSYICKDDPCDIKEGITCNRACVSTVAAVPVVIVAFLGVVSLIILYFFRKRSAKYKTWAQVEVVITWGATIGLLIALLYHDGSVWLWVTLCSTVLMGVIPMLYCLSKKLLSGFHIITSLVVLLGLSVVFESKEVVYGNLVSFAVVTFVLSITASHYAYIEEKVNTKEVNIIAVYLIALLAVIIPILGFAFYDWLGYVLFTCVALFLAYVHKDVLLKTDPNAATEKEGGGGGWRQLRVVYR